MNKEIVYKKLQPYFDTGILREVYLSDYMSVLSIGDICYIGCPHMLINGEPLAVTILPSQIETFINDNNRFYNMMKIMINNMDKYKGVTFFLEAENIEIYKKYVDIKKSKGVSMMDYKLEEEIKKSKGRSL